ncbi:hypothetical protein ACFQBQ_03630 [Granulicella cerasi]|uniref:Lipoprotein n=1 Tax=Granulicella cerasi TaxID=741063 RepID=A0ABW1Z550_9BACT|nr:hypothetical protein [Granulicella cerasi]
MKLRRLVLATFSGLALTVAVGCAHRPPPPPPPPPPIVQFAEHAGFDTGHADGQRAAYNRAPADPYHTRAFQETPGYRPGMGPFRLYRESFRRAYVQGFGAGYAGR